MARRAVRRTLKQQSTLTQLDFISTPQSTTKHEEQIDSDEEKWATSVIPSRKRKRRQGVRSVPAKRKLDNTLTQIGFLQPDDFDEDEQEIVVDSQPSLSISIRASSPVQQDAVDDTGPRSEQISPGSNQSGHFRVPHTPKHRHRQEARSSQTPPSVVLSSIRSSRSGRVRFLTPLAPRSVEVQSSPSVQRNIQLARQSTIEDSQYDEPPLLPYSNDDASDSDSYHDELPIYHSGDTQAAIEQCTLDPAASALERDAARCRWTQMQQLHHKLAVEHDTQIHSPVTQSTRVPDPSVFPYAHHAADLPDANVDVASSTAPSSPLPRASQISTVLPTQSSPRPPPSSIEEITPLLASRHKTSTSANDATPLVVKTEPDMLPDLTLPSSPLPAPPWTESQRAEWLQTSRTRGTAKAEAVTLVDFSLPPPPMLSWDSGSSSIGVKHT